MTATWDAVVRDVLDEARRAAGGGAALAAKLKAAGVGPEAGAYSESAVSNWIKGRTRPPADVVLAAAAVYDLSLDRPLRIASASSNVTQPIETESDVEQLRAAVARLETLVNTKLAAQALPAPAVKDLVAVHATRAEAQAEAPPVRTIARAERVDAMGLSLNAICQGVSDVSLAEFIENGLRLRCLFLDPDGDAVRAREVEEGFPAGHLADITRTNIHALQRLRTKLTPEALDRLQLRTYDETLRFNITLVDETRAFVQPYLHHARGLDSPTLVIEANDDEPHGLFPIFERAIAEAWESGRDVGP